eukprot:7303250-Heterocapsa_arctica.AAC.1
MVPPCPYRLPPHREIAPPPGDDRKLLLTETPFLEQRALRAVRTGPERRALRFGPKGRPTTSTTTST